MFEHAGRTQGVPSVHSGAPGQDGGVPAAPAAPVLEDAQAIIALLDALTGMVPAAIGPISGAESEARVGPSEEELAAVTREAEAINRLRALEDLKAACAAAQARETAALRAHRLRDEAERGVPESRRGVGLGSEIGLALRMTPQPRTFRSDATCGGSAGFRASGSP